MRAFVHVLRSAMVVCSAAIAVFFVFATPLPSAATTNPFQEARTQLGTVADRAGTAASVQEGALETTIGRIIQSALSLLGVFFFGYMVWAGYLWMTAHGEEEQITKAKKMLTNAIIGLAITLGAYAITTFVILRLLEAAQVTA